MVNEVKNYKYENVKSYIQNGIDEGHFPPEGKIPGDNELMSIFNTSHITVRKALSDLVAEGKIYRIQGKGSFVSPLVNAAVMPDTFISQMLFSGEQSDSSFMGMIQGVGEYMSGKNINVRYDFINPGERNENEYIYKLISEKSNGAVLFLTKPDAHRDAMRALDIAGIPFVLIDRCARSYQTNYVGSNNISGGYEQVKCLAGHGHKKIGFFAFDIGISTERDRHAGYIEGLIEYCDSVPEILFFNRETFADDIVPMLERRDVTGLCVVNDRTAMFTINELERKGVSIPRDLSIIGFDDWETTRYIKPALTTIKQDFIQMGRDSARLLYEAMNYKKTRGKAVLLPITLIERDSVADI